VQHFRLIGLQAQGCLVGEAGLFEVSALMQSRAKIVQAKGFSGAIAVACSSKVMAISV